MPDPSAALVGQSDSRSLAAVAVTIEDVAGRLSLASSPGDLETAVNDLLTIAANARSGVLGA